MHSHCLGKHSVRVRGQVSGLRVRRRNEAKGRENEAELGGSSASGPVIFNQGFNLEEHNRFLLVFLLWLCGELLIFFLSKNSGHKIPSRLNHKAPRNMPEHSVSNPKTQGLKCWSQPSWSLLSLLRLSSCNCWLSWLWHWSV